MLKTYSDPIEIIFKNPWKKETSLMVLESKRHPFPRDLHVNIAVSGV